MKTILRVLAKVSLSLSMLPGADTPPSALAAALQKTAAGLAAGGFVAVESVNGHVTYTAAGHPGPRENVPPEKVIFEIGSISKVFTSLLLAQTVLEGKAALTDPIAKFLPPELHLDPKVAALTLEQLATHTSGLPRMPSNFAPANPLDPYADYEVAQLYAYLGRYHPSTSAPQPWAYSNLGGGLLGHLLERIHGQNYAELLAIHITGPLGMSDTVLTLNQEQASRLAPPFSGSVRTQSWTFHAFQGAGGIRSTAADLVKFGQALLAPDSPIHAAWELARQPRASAGGPDEKIGLGILVTSAEGTTLYNHGGATGGYRSFFEVTPSMQRVVVVLLNNDAPDPGSVLIASRHPKHETSADTGAAVAISPAQLAEYVGNYSLGPRQRFTALVDGDGRLRLRLTSQPFLSVLYVGHDRFMHKGVGAEFQFTRDATGKIDGVTLYQRGRELPARRTSDPVPVVLFLTPDKLQEYVGKYQLSPDTIFEISVRAGHLMVKITGQPTVAVFCDRADHFVYDVVEAALAFERDDAGAVTAVTLHQDGRVTRAPRLAEK